MQEAQVGAIHQNPRNLPPIPMQQRKIKNRDINHFVLYNHFSLSLLSLSARHHIHFRTAINNKEI